MSSKNGISLITLVITIVIMIIIASIAIFYGVEKNMTTAYEADRYTEMRNISEAVKKRNLANRMRPSLYPYVGTPLTSENPRVINGISYGDDWYLLTSTESVELELESVEKDYIINYITGEVIALIPFTYNDKDYYALGDLDKDFGGQKTEVTEDMFDANGKVNRPILIKGMIPVRNVNGKWIVTNSEDQRWYDYSADNNVWANVMLSDEITITGYTNEEIKSLPLAELEGREVQTSGSMMVWLPRCTTSGNQITYSRLLQDYINPSEGFELDPYFLENPSETGVWITKYDAELKYN